MIRLFGDGYSLVKRCDCTLVASAALSVAEGLKVASVVLPFSQDFVFHL